MTGARRLLNYVCIVSTCITAGSIFTLPLWSTPLARALHLTSAQSSSMAAAAVFLEYASAVFWGIACDQHGPARVAFAAALLFAVGWGMLGWRYSVSVDESQPQGQWIWLAAYFGLAGASTSASYFAAIVASTKSMPKRYSGIAIAVPCALFGLSPLFLSAIATRYFTVPSVDLVTGRDTDELDPGKWFAFLAVLLFCVNLLGAFGLRVIPWEEEEIVALREEDDEQRTRPGASERTPLLAGSPASKPDPLSEDSHSISTLLSKPTFWLLGFVILLSIGPCEMVLSTLGSQIESLLGVHTNSAPSGALALQRTHVQIISAVQTGSRLLVGALSDWLSYDAVKIIPPSNSAIATSTTPLAKIVRTRPQVSRLLFVFLASILLAGVFGYVAFFLDHPNQLWVLSGGVGLGYGSLFTLAPSILRATYPVADFGRNFGIISCDAIVKGIPTTFTTSILVIVSAVFFGAPLTWIAGIGCVCVFVTSWTYIRAGLVPAAPLLLEQTSEGKSVEVPKTRKKNVALGFVMLAAIFGLVGLTCAIYGIPTIEGSASSQSNHLIVGDIDLSTTCERRPLRSSPSSFNGTRTRHDFDDVLMIVFFNKPYYRLNIESFNEAYSPYFKNMLFIGPRSQESDSEPPYPEVVVDSYADYRSGNAGRLAHHALYMAMKKNPCYAGYLWVAFDVFINIPHLTPSSRKIACGLDSMATLAPDLTENLLVAGKIQTINLGVADFAYIPGHLRDPFIRTLDGLKSCFLEFALPTALRAITSPNQPAAFITVVKFDVPTEEQDERYIAAQWAAGFEVDMFHQYHWKDLKGPNPWTPRTDAVSQIRELWAQGFARIASAKAVESPMD